MRIVGIETSCDETGLALYDAKAGLLGQLLHSQVDIHNPHGGVVPELASRDHIRRVLPMFHRLLLETKTKPSALDAIAYTAGPGLAGALMVGAAVAHGLCYALKIPAIAVHHMEAHLLAAALEDSPPPHPFVALLVSGGHTLLALVKSPGHYNLLGTTRDDAAGEAIDKIAKLLGLPYPGGPHLERLAQTGNNNNPHSYQFTRPMQNSGHLDFSFSGLKTQVARTVATEADSAHYPSIAHAFMEAVVDVLTTKCRDALQQTGVRTLVAAGGVVANKALRLSLAKMTKRAGAAVYYPRTELCTDNGAMIAYSGYLKLKNAPSPPLPRHCMQFSVYPRWSLESLMPPP